MRRGPTLPAPSTVAAAATGCAVAGVVAVGAGAFVPFVGELAGLALFAVGTVARKRRRMIGAAVGGLGVVVALAGAAATAAAAPDLNGLAVVPAAVGAFVLVAGLAARRRPRLATTVGTGGLLSSVLVAGALGTVSTVELLIAGAGTVLAWDLGEQAVDLGERGGASTLRAEAVHASGTALVGALGVGVALGSTALDVGDAALPAVIVALFASVGLAALLGD